MSSPVAIDRCRATRHKQAGYSPWFCSGTRRHRSCCTVPSPTTLPKGHQLGQKLSHSINVYTLNYESLKSVVHFVKCTKCNIEFSYLDRGRVYRVCSLTPQPGHRSPRHWLARDSCKCACACLSPQRMSLSRIPTCSTYSRLHPLVKKSSFH